jgi:hypothetical protein
VTKRRWIRFNYLEPQKVLRVDTGVPTGRSILYVRAIRSDGFLYQCNADISDRDAENPSLVEAVRRHLVRYLEQSFLDDVPPVNPCGTEAFKGQNGWIEADLVNV